MINIVTVFLSIGAAEAQTRLHMINDKYGNTDGRIGRIDTGSVENAGTRITWMEKMITDCVLCGGEPPRLVFEPQRTQLCRFQSIRCFN
jgi:hypothetical protein